VRNLALSFLLALTPAAVFAADTPTAEAIMDRYVEVTGGKQAYEGLKTEMTTGVMEMKAQGIKGKMSGFRNAQNFSYNVVEIDGVGKIEEGFHEGIAWEKSAMGGPRVKTGEEKAFYMREAILARDARWRDVYSKAELSSEETIDGVVCFKLILTPKEGSRTETQFFEKATGFRKRISMVMSTQMGDLPVESTLSDYKDFGGFKAPSKVSTKMAGQELSVTISTMEFNKEIPASRFVPPADVKAIAAKVKAAPAK
jgi:hypothetical protein